MQAEAHWVRQRIACVHVRHEKRAPALWPAPSILRIVPNLLGGDHLLGRGLKPRRIVEHAERVHVDFEDALFLLPLAV